MGNDSFTMTFKDQLGLVLRNWYWFVLSLIVALCIAYLMNRYATDIFQASTTVLIKDTKSGGLSEAGALGDLNILGNSYNTVENEIEVFKSRRLMKQVVSKDDLFIDYRVQGRVKLSPVYYDQAVTVRVLNKKYLDSLQDLKPHNFTLSPIDSINFKFTDVEGRSKSYKYGSIVNYGKLELIVTYNDIDKEKSILDYDPILVAIQSVESAAISFLKRLLVSKVDRRSSVLTLSLTDPVPARAEDVLNGLVAVYNEDAINDKNAVARKTATFIQERLDEVQKDLDSLERRLQSFKDDRDLTDLATESVINLEKSTGLGSEVIAIETQLNLARSVQRSMQKADYSLLPQSFGFANLEIEDQANRFNQLLLSYNDLRESASDINPSVIELKRQLDSLKESIQASIDQLVTSLQAQSSSLQRELNQKVGEIRRVPENERLNRDILRNREVVESIYLLLSEKRETTAISLVVTSPKAKIVDFAMSNPVPVSPKPTVIYLISVALGLLFPFGLLYASSILYNKISTRDDLNTISSNISVLGEVPKLSSIDKDTIEVNDRSVLAESFRILRTNLQYKLSALKQYKRDVPVILTTSTIKGEGKTFVSFNLALTLALTNKRVLLIGADVRNPQLHRYMPSDARMHKGLTEYLVNDEFEVADIMTKHQEIPGLDIILSGAIPPNPAELIMSERMRLLLDTVTQEYDYILLDSAPTILVADTLLISEFADVTVYVARANFTDKPLLDFIADNVQEKKLHNIAMVLNDVKQANLGYGSKYTYSYSQNRTSLWSKLRRLLGLG